MGQFRGAVWLKIIFITLALVAIILLGISYYYVTQTAKLVAQTPAAAPANPDPKAVLPFEPVQATERMLFAQVIDAEPKDVFKERAILEGKPFKHLLKRAAAATSKQVREATDDRILFENLGDEADLHRGKAYTPGYGVIVEISKVELPPEYGFPSGWTVLPAIFLNTAREVYALRIISPPGSTLYEKLNMGIERDELPVLNLAGFFFKNYARKTSDEKEPPWVRPLLVCPEPDIADPSQEKNKPRSVFKELDEAGFSRLLPSLRIDAPGAEERLVIEILPGQPPVLRIDGVDSPYTDASKILTKAVDQLKSRLNAEQATDPSAVLWYKKGVLTDAELEKLSASFKAIGVNRVYTKENVLPSNAGK